MREIKFRAWDLKYGGWHDDLKVYQNGAASSDGVWQPSKEIALMQFTGIKDKNGKEIYEGDIIKVIFGYDSNAKPQEKSRTGAVEYFAPYAMFALHGIGFHQLNLCPVEVIGNIYEHPERLKQTPSSKLPPPVSPYPPSTAR